jgi:hypothetical protein
MPPCVTPSFSERFWHQRRVSSPAKRRPVREVLCALRSNGTGHNVMWLPCVASPLAPWLRGEASDPWRPPG